MQFHLGVTFEIIDDWLRQDAPSGDLRESAAHRSHAHATRLAEVAASAT